MTRRAVLALTAVITALLTLLAVTGSAAASTEELRFLDTFAKQSFAGNDGTEHFSGPWKELGESDGPAEGGRVWVWPHEVCPDGYCLKIGGYQVRIEGAGVERSVDLEGARKAQLSFDVRRLLMGMESSARLQVRVSADGGSTWKTLASYRLDANDTASAHAEFDIADFAGPETTIAFVGAGGKVESYVLIDNVEIVATVRTKTATTSTSSTKAPERTTSTTAAPDRTTTTAAVTPAATTTEPPSTTSTTPPGAISATPPPRPPTTGGTGEALDDIRFWTKDGMATADLAVGMPPQPTSVSSPTPISQFLSTVDVAQSMVVDHLLEAFVLGVFVAWLAVRGLARKMTVADPDSTP